MTRDEVICIYKQVSKELCHGDKWIDSYRGKQLHRFAALVAAAEREKVAAWMIERSYATGHGDTVEDLLKELEWQARESEREACAKLCDEQGESPALAPLEKYRASFIADAIRARGKK